MAHAVSVEPFLQFAELLGRGHAPGLGHGGDPGREPGRGESARAQPATAPREAAGRRHDRHSREPWPRTSAPASDPPDDPQRLRPWCRSDGTALACRTEGAVLRPRSEEAEALIVLRLIPEADRVAVRRASQKIAELGREIQQRVRVEQRAPRAARVARRHAGQHRRCRDRDRHHRRRDVHEPDRRDADRLDPGGGLGRPLDEVFPSSTRRRASPSRAPSPRSSARAASSAWRTRAS